MKESNNINNIYKIFSLQENNLISKSLDSNEIEHYEFKIPGTKYYFFLSKYRFEFNDFFDDKKPLNYITFNLNEKNFNLVKLTAKEEVKIKINLNKIKEEIDNIIDSEKKILKNQKIEIWKIKNPNSYKELTSIYLSYRYLHFKKISKEINNKLIENKSQDLRIEELKEKTITEFKDKASIYTFSPPLSRLKELNPNLEKCNINSIKEIDNCIILEVEGIIINDNKTIKKVIYYINSTDSSGFNFNNKISLDSIFNDFNLINEAKKNNELTEEFLNNFKIEFQNYLEKKLTTRIETTINKIHNIIRDENYKFKEIRQKRLKEEENIRKTDKVFDYLNKIKKS